MNSGIRSIGDRIHAMSPMSTKRTSGGADLSPTIDRSSRSTSGTTPTMSRIGHAFRPQHEEQHEQRGPQGDEARDDPDHDAESMTER